MHLLQSPPWGAFKSQFGWSAQSVLLASCQQPVQVLYRQLPLGFKIAYIPKGPPINWADLSVVRPALTQLKRIAAHGSTVFLKIEPDTLDDPAVVQQFLTAGFRPGRPVQPVNTIIVDISASEETILAAMKPKTRYNIRLAQRKGITVRVGSLSDLAVFYDLSQVTAQRDGFAIHPLAYYQAACNQFSADQRALLLAEYEGQPLAGLMVFTWEDRAYYLYGASNNEHREKMPTYLLQWEAIKWAKARGCRSYDLWGVPDAPLETLEAEFTERHDGLWGVYRHKRGFGGQVVRSVGAFDYIYKTHWHKRIIYGLLTRFLERRSRDL